MEGQRLGTEDEELGVRPQAEEGWDRVLMAVLCLYSSPQRARAASEGRPAGPTAETTGARGQRGRELGGRTDGTERRWGVGAALGKPTCPGLTGA